MQRNMFKRCAAALAAAIVLALCLPFGAFAETKTGSISISLPPAADGVQYKLYQVGTFEDGHFILTGDYADYDVDPSTVGAAQTLEALVIRDGLKHTAAGATQSGSLVFNNVPMGLYLVCGMRAEIEDTIYQPIPSLVSIPLMNSGSELWNVTISGKYGLPVKRIVEKYWEGVDTASQPKEITVDLKKDGVVVQSVKLNERNHWSYTWNNLPSENKWTVEEQVIPGFKPEYVYERGEVLTKIINKPDTSHPSTPGKPPQLPSTGQLWWPVSALAFAGLSCLILGMARRRSFDHET